jgi:hypothetical protein
MKRQASLETPWFKVWIDPDLPPDKRSESISAIIRYCIDPPRPQAERRRVAVRTAMAQYRGSASGRAKELERRYRSYLASGWPRERDLETFPGPRSTERVLLHRLAPGEVATIAVLAANRPQARSIFRYISGILKAVPLFARMVVDENTEAITLANRVVIEIGTASFRSGNDRPLLPRDRASSGVCRRRRDALAEFHRADSHARSERRDLR